MVIAEKNNWEFRESVSICMGSTSKSTINYLLLLANTFVDTPVSSEFSSACCAVLTMLVPCDCKF